MEIKVLVVEETETRRARDSGREIGRAGRAGGNGGRVMGESQEEGGEQP